MKLNEGYIAVYLRISREEHCLGAKQTESSSIANQRKVLRYFISQNEELAHYPVKEFIDDGYTGVNFNRPGIQKLLSEVRENKVACIVVKDVSRLGRNYIAVGDFMEQIFPLLGVRVISVNDNYDSVKNQIGIEIGLRNLIHELYSKDLSKKIKSVKKMHQEKGIYSGGDAPYGYTKPDKNKNVYQPDAAAAQVVKEIFILAAKGHSTGEIAEYLNERLIPIPGVYKNQNANENYSLKNHKRNLWTAAQVREIIGNETYTGTFICHKSTSLKPGESKKNARTDYMKYENAHEGLVDKELFETAQKVVMVWGKRGNYKKNKNPHALKGKVKCGHCGYSMNLDERLSDGSFYCRMGNSCGFHTKIQAGVLEKAVLAALQKQMAVLKRNTGNYRSKRMEQIADLNKGKAKKRKLEMNIEHCKSCRIILYRQWKDSQITKDKFILKRNEFKKREQELKGQLERIDEEINHLAVKQTDSDWNRFPDDETVNTVTKELADNLVERIDIYDTDRVEITWGFPDEIEKLAEN